MSIPDGTILRIVASYLWSDGEINQNVFNAEVNGAGAPWDDQDIVDDAVDWVETMYNEVNGLMSDEIASNEVAVYKYDAGDDDWDEVGSASFAQDGVNVGDQFPRGNAALVKLWTEDPDVQGKKYLPGFVETSTTDGLITAATLTAMLAFAVEWWTPFVGIVGGGTFTPGIWSVVGKVIESAVEHYAASAIMAYQRRRKRGVGI